jgi:Holliday junction resolvase-like predicted endonuclease
MNLQKGQYSFRKDINTGKLGEDILLEFYTNKGWTLLDRCETSDYDLRIQKGELIFTMEIKTDVFENTGNMAIEFFSRDKPSGIDATKADFFIYYFPFLGEIWSIKTSELKELIKKEKFRQVVGGDKGSNTAMYLIKKEKYKKDFKVTYIEKIPKA